MTRFEPAVAMGILAAAARVVDRVQAGVVARGFTDVRPVHGFAFARIAAGGGRGATTLELAAHLGMTKQAASQLAQVLVERGYLERIADRADARRRPLILTARGQACTRAAEDAAAEAIRSWRPALGADGVRQLGELLGRLDLAGPVRPSW